MQQGAPSQAPPRTAGVSAPLVPHGPCAACDGVAEDGSAAQLCAPHTSLHGSGGTPPALAEALTAYPEMWHLFAGGPRGDDVGSCWRARGLPTREYDLCRDPSHDLRPGRFADGLVERAAGGGVGVVLAGVPCETFSAARKRVLRPRDTPVGFTAGLTARELTQLADSDDTVELTCHVCMLVWRHGGGFVIENPADRGIRGTPFFWAAKAGRASLRQHPAIVALQAATGAVWVFSPMCFWGAPVQKWTMFLIAPAMLPYFPALRTSDCTHQHHGELAWGVDDCGHGRAKGQAAYVPELCHELANGSADFVAARRVDGLAGEIRWGGALRPEVRRALDAARSAVPRFASHRRLDPVPPDQRWCQPMPPEADAPPDDTRADAAVLAARSVDSDGSDDETLATAPVGFQRPVRSAWRVPGMLALRVAYWMMWLPMPEFGDTREGLLRILRWRDAAAVAQRALRSGGSFVDPGYVSVPASFKHPHFRELLVDSRNPADCVVVRRSSRHSVLPGSKRLDKAAFRAACEEVGWDEVDPDIVQQGGDTGVASRSTCGFFTVLAFHHTGVQEDHAAVDAILLAEAADGWLLGPFEYCPPFEPFKALPRNVVFQSRPKMAEDGAVFEFMKARVTTNSSFAPAVLDGGGTMRSGLAVGDSPNGGTSAPNTYMQLPSQLRHARAAAVVDAYGDGASVRGGMYSTDRSNAFGFCDEAREEWWLKAFFWELPRGLMREGAAVRAAGQRGSEAEQAPLDGDAWRLGRASAALGDEGWLPPAAERTDTNNLRTGWVLGTRGHFGGGHMPNRFGRLMRPIRALVRKRQRAFDEEHPLPACAVRVQRRRIQLQAAGMLPEGIEQVEPADVQSFIDDFGGSGLTDVTGVPASLAHIELDLSEMAVHGGVPASLDTRIANYARVDIDVTRQLGFSISAKTQVGDGVVSLGFRISVAGDRVDCPPVKRAAILHTCGVATREMALPMGIVLKPVRSMVGRLGNLSQIFPSLLGHMFAGYAVTEAAGAHVRRLPRVRKLRRGSLIQRAFAEFLQTTAEVIGANEGVPLLSQPAFEAAGSDGVLVVTTDASRQGDMSGVAPPSPDDGLGGFAFDPRDPRRVVLVSEPWPAAVRSAMARSAARRAAQLAMPGPRCSMPVAELFGAWACARAAAAALGIALEAVVSVTDCAPAAAACVTAKTRSTAMRPILAAMRRDASRLLGVWVPRELNTDADTLSHPSQVARVVADAEAHGFTVVRAAIPEACWQLLLRAIGEAGEAAAES